ncbi:MAG: hypothetical protein EBU52_22240, partial [Cytophagia bacterium]|nr:hypothetical protein [Cytophagia bacterium]
MRTFLSFCFFALFVLPGLCQIHITTHEVWQQDTVKVEQNIIIDEGATLTINPGTVVIFIDKNFIDVYGELNINGNEGDSVIMTSVDSTWIMVNAQKLYYGWGGLYAYNNG